MMPLVQEEAGKTRITHPEQFAKLTGFSKRYVQKLCATGKLPATKFGGRWFIDQRAALKLLGIED